MKILPCERRDRAPAFSRLRSSQLNSIELPIHMIPAIRCAHRNTTSSSSLAPTRGEYRQPLTRRGSLDAMMKRGIFLGLAILLACGGPKPATRLAEPARPSRPGTGDGAAE